ncbi:MAG: type II toxin-antitoxin system HicB family antitoxin [Planctomycetota bacterium]
MLTYTAAYFFDGDGIHAELLDYPGVLSCGVDLDDARENLGAALVDMLESDLSDGRPVPTPKPASDSPEADLVEPLHVVMKGGPEVVTDIAAAGQ